MSTAIKPHRIWSSPANVSVECQGKELGREMDATTRREMEKAKDCKRRRVYREQRRTERQQEIQTLTDELQKARRGEETNWPMQAWKLVALRELVARQSAEAHQKRLWEEIVI
ncbi:hypothetical protein PHYPSEUDO_005159 [Phytophthora pseudosyringae]|uniref:Uncharacterized protein n=1 Tax=Phytophthora pseudosyringae TaxID=221518 RepID=A0A8T1VRY3_9STRA|nr:hypothetical protein PHYPSEUDO_005159 [Phytophthora pseudosyringae]